MPQVFSTGKVFIPVPEPEILDRSGAIPATFGPRGLSFPHRLTEGVWIYPDREKVEWIWITTSGLRVVTGWRVVPL